MSFHRLGLQFYFLACALAWTTASEPTDMVSTAITSSYWDCCKPSCAADGQAQVSSPVSNCDSKNRPLNNPVAVSSCQKGSNGQPRGPSYMCANQAPFVDESGQAYAFAAVSPFLYSAAGSCCACFRLNYTDGPAKRKNIIIQTVHQMPETINSTFALAVSTCI